MIVSSYQNSTFFRFFCFASGPSALYLYSFVSSFELSLCHPFPFLQSRVSQYCSIATIQHRPSPVIDIPFGMFLILPLSPPHSLAKDSRRLHRQCVRWLTRPYQHGILVNPTFLNIHTPVFLHFPHPHLYSQLHPSRHIPVGFKTLAHKSLSLCSPQGPLCSTLAPVSATESFR